MPYPWWTQLISRFKRKEPPPPLGRFGVPRGASLEAEPTYTGVAPERELTMGAVPTGAKYKPLKDEYPFLTEAQKKLLSKELGLQKSERIGREVLGNLMLLSAPGGAARTVGETIVMKAVTKALQSGAKPSVLSEIAAAATLAPAAVETVLEVAPKVAIKTAVKPVRKALDVVAKKIETKLGVEPSQATLETLARDVGRAIGKKEVEALPFEKGGPAPKALEPTATAVKKTAIPKGGKIIPESKISESIVSPTGDSITKATEINKLSRRLNKVAEDENLTGIELEPRIKSEVIKEFGEDFDVTLYRGIKLGKTENIWGEPYKEGQPGGWWSTSYDRAKRYAGKEGKVYQTTAKASDLANGELATANSAATDEFHLGTRLQAQLITEEVGALPYEKGGLVGNKPLITEPIKKQATREPLITESLPEWTGKAYRSPTGFTQERGTTAADVVNYESKTLGNADVAVSEEVLDELRKHSARDVVWVTKTKRTAARYGRPEVEEGLEGGRILAEDGDGGYLVLKPPEIKPTSIGGKPPVPPKPPPPVALAGPPAPKRVPREDPVEKLVNILRTGRTVPEYKALRRVSAPMRAAASRAEHVEAKRKAAIYAKMLKGAKTPEDVARASAALKGEMPKPSAINAPSAMGYTSQNAKDLIKVVKVAKLRPYENKNVMDALFGETGKEGLIYGGKLPTMYELGLIERVFGESLTSELLMNRPLSQKLLTGFLSAINIPRSILTSLDLSAPGRQGIVLLPAHPKEWAAAWGPQVKALLSEKYAKELNQRALGEIGDKVSREIARGRLTDGLYVAPYAKIVGHLGAQEEAYATKHTSRWLGTKQSERAYITYLNQLRINTFDTIIRGWERSGKKFTALDRQELARFINRATGRGELWAGEYITPLARRPMLGGAGQLLNAAFFSPRLQTSRILLPFSMASKSGLVRKEAAKSLVAFVGAGATALALLAAHPDIEVETDPKSTDFGRVRIGNTTYDFWGGFQPYVRTMAQIISGQRKNLASGNIIPTSRAGVAEGFIRGKLAPIPGIIIDVKTGRTFTGEELDWSTKSLGEVVKGNFLPMSIQDTLDAVAESDWLTGSLQAIPAFGGAGVNTFDRSQQYVTEINTLTQYYRTQIAKVNRLLAQGRSKEAEKILIEDPYLERGQVLLKVKSAIDEHERLRGDIEKSVDYTQEEKDTLMQEQDEIIIELAQTAILQSEGLIK